MFILKPGFHYTASATTTTQKQNDYKVEQSSFTLIALFWLVVVVIIGLMEARLKQHMYKCLLLDCCGSLYAVDNVWLYRSWSVYCIFLWYMFVTTRQNFRYSIKLNKLYKMTQLKKNNDRIQWIKINKNKISPSVRGIKPRLVSHKSYIIRFTPQTLWGFINVENFICWFAQPRYNCRENAVIQMDFLEEKLFLNLDCVMVMWPKYLLSCALNTGSHRVIVFSKSKRAENCWQNFRWILYKPCWFARCLQF